MPRIRWTYRRLSGMAVGVAALLAGCGGITVGRDLSHVNPGTVGFEDMCGLQDYFDTIEIKEGTPPRLLSAVDLDGGRAAAGKARWSFETPFQLRAVRHVLTQNWRQLPADIATVKRIDIEVAWTKRAGIERVVTDDDARLIIGSEDRALPYHVCLTELLYGAPLYQQRRLALGLPLRTPSLKAMFGPPRATPTAPPARAAPTPAAAQPPAPELTPTPAPATPAPTPTPTPAPASEKPAFRPAPPAPPL